MTPERPKEKPAREKLSKLEPAPKDIHKALPDINPSLCAPLINTSDYDSPSRDTKAKGFTALAINEEGANALNWEQARRDLRLTTRATPFRLLVLALDQMCARKPLRTTYTLVHRAHGGRTQLKFLISEKKFSSFTQAKSLSAMNSVENAYCEFELLEEKHVSLLPVEYFSVAHISSDKCTNTYLHRNGLSMTAMWRQCRRYWRSISSIFRRQSHRRHPDHQPGQSRGSSFAVLSVKLSLRMNNRPYSRDPSLGSSHRTSQATSSTFLFPSAHLSPSQKVLRRSKLSVDRRADP